jgi:Dioxygenases related to 2-nitropropane dioxygenase
MNRKVLNTTYPIIQAPMNWVTDAHLVAAVSNAGGLGVLGTNAGQNEITDDPRVVASRMKVEIQKTRQLTDELFGINILPPVQQRSLSSAPFTKAVLETAFEAHIHYFVVVGNVHEETFKLIKQHGGVIIFRPLTPTVSEAKQAEALGADIIVATGHDEGGILPNQEQGTFTIVPAIVDAVSIPVFAAGGINDRRTAKAALALGASGIYVGTRFLVSEESPVADNVKALIVASGSENTIMVSGNQRAIDTERASEFATRYQQTRDTAGTNQLISKDGGLRKAMLLGQVNAGIITVNNGISLIKKTNTVSEIISELFN